LRYLRPDLLQLQPYAAVPPLTADKLDANEFPWDWPVGFKQKLSLLWEEEILSNRYPDAQHRRLKQAIAAYAGAAPEQISVGNGSDELIRSLLIATCLGDRGGILVPEPTFSMYAILAESLGIPVVRVPPPPRDLCPRSKAVPRGYDRAAGAGGVFGGSQFAHRQWSNGS
jgi:histidinol-phosphate aminotransferase